MLEEAALKMHYFGRCISTDLETIFPLFGGRNGKTTKNDRFTKLDVCDDIGAHDWRDGGPFTRNYLFSRD
jgi:hypothetical protein